MPKHEAQGKLAGYITEYTGRLTKQGDSISTFSEPWKAFCAVKSGQWSKKTKENLQCLFGKHVVPIIGPQAPREVTLTSLQLPLNKMAEDGYRKSESTKLCQKGDARIGDTKTDESDNFVPVRPDLEREVRAWIATHPHRNDSHAFLFLSSAGTAFSVGNYLT